MTSLKKRLEKAHSRRNERVLAAQLQRNQEPSVTPLAPSQHSHSPGTSMFEGQNRKGKTVPKPQTLNKPPATKRSTTTAVGLNIGDKSRIAPKVYRQPSYWDTLGGDTLGLQGNRKRGKTTEAIGFNLGNKDRVNPRPQWANKLIEAGLDPMGAIQGLTVDEVSAYLKEEGQLYQLSEADITLLKHLVELQLLIESDPDVGVIEGTDEVLNLMARLAAVGGDLTELHPTDQAAILSLIQFNNVVPGFGVNFDEDAIEAAVDGANNFVQYTDCSGASVFIRKGSYVKAQVIERKLEQEMINFDKYEKMRFISIVLIILVYLLMKITILIYAIAFSGKCNGYYMAMLKIENLNEQVLD